jgi:PHD/FYVE-zinc-finger like domain
LCYKNGHEALEEYQNYSKGRRRTRGRRKETKSFEVISDSESEDVGSSSDEHPTKRRRTLVRGAAREAKRISTANSRRTTRSTRSGRLISLLDDDEDDMSDSTAARRSTRVKTKKSLLRYNDNYQSDDERSEVTSILSRSSAKPRTPKAIEYFPLSSKDTQFVHRHHLLCMYSTDMSPITEDDERNYAMCQGCSFVYHVECLGDKAARLRTGHNVIAVDERDRTRTCVLQCGRCSGRGKNGANTSRCAGCGEIGERCGEFEHPKKLEGSDEMDVDGSDDAADEKKVLRGWNDATKLMFRCMECHRAYHFHHLPSPVLKEKQNREPLDDIEVLLNESQNIVENITNYLSSPKGAADLARDSAEISISKPATKEKAKAPASTTDPPSHVPEEDALASLQWRCDDCTHYSEKKVEKVLGWRPIADPLYSTKDPPEDFLREYLIKFENDSYARALWVPGTWLAGVAFVMKRNFDAEELRQIKAPEDVIPEKWLRADIVFDVRYEGDLTRDQMNFRTQEDELAALSKVTQALCKYQQLRYEECTCLSYNFLIIATWDAPPAQDSPRFSDFKASYEEHVRGNWTHSPQYRGKKSPYADPSKSEDVIQAEFGHRLEKKTQPEWMEGGEMFDYQLEGMKYPLL